MGAYCIEEELLLRRRFGFSLGIAPLDIVEFPNTAGYLMHIAESLWRQLSLTTKLRWDSGVWVLAGVDALTLGLAP